MLLAGVNRSPARILAEMEVTLICGGHPGSRKTQGKTTDTVKYVQLLEKLFTELVCTENTSEVYNF